MQNLPPGLLRICGDVIVLGQWLCKVLVQVCTEVVDTIECGSGCTVGLTIVKERNVPAFLCRIDVSAILVQGAHDEVPKGSPTHILPV